MQINKISIFSLAKIQAVMFAFVGLIMGIFFIIIGKSIISPISSFSEISDLSATLWISGIIVIPIAMGIVGFILGIFEAIIYNFTSRKIGGIELETDDRRIIINSK